MKTITITVKEKIATAPKDAFIVCGNSDIKVSFVFDGEWADAGTKTAVFVCSDGSAYYAEIVDDSCTAPAFYSTAYVKIGVASANIITSTSATVSCKAAVTDEAEGEGTVGDSQYEALCKILDGRFPTGGVAGDMLIKQSEKDYDASWGVSDEYCKAKDVYTKDETAKLLLDKATKRSVITQASETVSVGDSEDYFLTDVGAVRFFCENPIATDCNIMLTTAAAGDVGISFEGIIAYSGPDPVLAGNGETWEFDILRGRCIGRKWA